MDTPGQDGADAGTPIDRRKDGIPIKRRCIAHRKDGGRCLRSASHGATVCHSHGGAAGQVRRVAAGRVAEEKARQACLMYAVRVDESAMEALTHELETSAGAVRWLRARVDEDGPESPWYQTYTQERDYQLAVAKVLIVGDVQGQLVMVARRMGAQFDIALRAVADRLELQPEQLGLLPGAVDEALRMILPPDGPDDGT